MVQLLGAGDISTIFYGRQGFEMENQGSPSQLFSSTGYVHYGDVELFAKEEKVLRWKVKVFEYFNSFSQ